MNKSINYRNELVELYQYLKRKKASKCVKDMVTTRRSRTYSKIIYKRMKTDMTEKDWSKTNTNHDQGYN